MISAGNFAAGFHPKLKMPFLTFSFALTQPFAKDGVNRVFVYLKPSDEYRVDFFKEVTGQPLPESPVHTFDGMYADQLIELFESTTELYLTL